MSEARPDLRGAFGEVYRGAEVLVTGSTGFKGSWLCWWLHLLGARVTGAALPPPTDPSLFERAALREVIDQREGDVRDPAFLRDLVAERRPSVVFHLAAQPIVRESYEDPAGTFATNVMGTVHLLEAVRAAGRPCAVVVVTSDKCYENVGWEHGYRETDALGGHDPYSASKACAELVAQSYRRSFFAPARLSSHGVAVASARAGNVIGPGDWARDRIVPDIVRALLAREPVRVRSPRATRPWQHVLDALSGYLLLGQRLLGGEAAACEGWNFGPSIESNRPVRDLVTAAIGALGEGSWEDVSGGAAPHEAHALHLSTDKAAVRLGWRPAWGFDEAVARTCAGYRALADDVTPDAARRMLTDQALAYAAAGERVLA